MRARGLGVGRAPTVSIAWPPGVALRGTPWKAVLSVHCGPQASAEAQPVAIGDNFDTCNVCFVCWSRTGLPLEVTLFL